MLSSYILVKRNTPLFFHMGCGVSFVDLFLFCLFHTVMSVSCSLVFTCWERADLLAVLCRTYFCYFPIWCPGFCKIFACINSCNLPSSLLCSE